MGQDNAVVYCRVSTQEQVKNYSLDTQELGCRNEGKNLNMQIVAVFREEGESGKTLKRPVLAKMLDYCQNKKNNVKWLLVHRLDRLSRNAEKHFTIKAMLLKYGVRLRSVSEPVDESPYGKFLEIVFAGIGQLDNDVRGLRTVDGMTKAIEAGYWPSVPPVGYEKRKPQRRRNPLIQNPDQAPLIKKAFELMASGQYSIETVRKKCTALGLQNRRGKEIAPQKFGDLLRSEIYCGWIVFPSWKVRAKGLFEPIISEDLFQNTQRVLRGARNTGWTRIKDRPEFPLRRFL